MLRWSPARALFWVLTPIVALWCLVMGTATMERNSALVGLAIAVVPVALVALASSDAAARTWAAERGARFDQGWNRTLQQHLLRTRLARTLGVCLPISANFLLMSRYNADPASMTGFPELSSSGWGFWVLGLGYVLGSWWAEWTKPRQHPDATTRTAVLTPRRLGDYLDPNVRWFLVLAAGLAAVMAASWFVGSWVIEPAAGAPQRLAASQVVVLGSIGVAALAFVVAWWACRRRERTSDDASLAFEELTRTATINALAGVVVAMATAVTYELAVDLLSMPGRSAWLWAQLPFVLLSYVGLAIWAGAGTKLVFRSRRIEAIRAAA